MNFHYASTGKSVLKEEIASLQHLYDHFNAPLFEQVVQLIFNHPGKVVFTGMGKSGYIARKLSSTFNSTGTRAVYLHPSEAVHGDLGIYSPGDPTILLSRSGSTPELLTLVPLIRQFQSPIIAILGNVSSPLAQMADFILDASIMKEADPLGFVPTASTTVAMALGDALACALMQARQFKHEDFLRFHPGGQLGKNLRACVGDFTHPLHEVACVQPQDSLRTIVVELTLKPLGAALVMSEGKFCGLITDGDIRRSLQTHQSIDTLTAEAIMTPKPITVFANLNLEDTIQLMESRPHPLNVLPVMNTDNTCRGLFRLHDAYSANILSKPSR